MFRKCVPYFFGSLCKTQGEKNQIKKLAKNQPKSGKNLKPEAIPSLLRNVGLVKVVIEFSFGHLKWYFWAHKDGHFWQKCSYSGTKKWHFRCPDENSFTTFISPKSPKKYGIAFGLKRLPYLGWF